MGRLRLPVGSGRLPVTETPHLMRATVRTRGGLAWCLDVAPLRRGARMDRWFDESEKPRARPCLAPGGGEMTHGATLATFQADGNLRAGGALDGAGRATTM